MLGVFAGEVVSEGEIGCQKEIGVSMGCLQVRLGVNARGVFR